MIFHCNTYFMNILNTWIKMEAFCWINFRSSTSFSIKCCTFWHVKCHLITCSHLYLHVITAYLRSEADFQKKLIITCHEQRLTVQITGHLCNKGVLTRFTEMNCMVWMQIHEHSLHIVRSNKAICPTIPPLMSDGTIRHTVSRRSWNSPFVTIVAPTRRSES